MLRRILCYVCIIALVSGLSGCGGAKDNVKIGVSISVGFASRWSQEKDYMEERAKELGAAIEVRLNTADSPKSQKEDCFEMIDSGIDVLIIKSRSAKDTKEILEYAERKKVRVINYARVAMNEKVDLFVGYDCFQIGQILGQYLTETVDQGDYIILRGDPGDSNATLLYNGAMRYISPLQSDIRIIMDEAVPGWSPAAAKKLVLSAVQANGNKVDAILAPNDKIAGACVEALTELGVTHHVVITGMDAELGAVKRIAAGKQDVTTYLDLKELAYSAVDEAYHFGANQPVEVNADFDNGIPGGIKAKLIAGKLVTAQNIDKLLIENGYFTKEEIYGTK